MTFIKTNIFQSNKCTTDLGVTLVNLFQQRKEETEERVKVLDKLFRVELEVIDSALDGATRSQSDCSILVWLQQRQHGCVQ